MVFHTEKDLKSKKPGKKFACIFFTKRSSYNKIFTLLKNSLLTSLQAEIEGGGAKGLPAPFGWPKVKQ